MNSLWSRTADIAERKALDTDCRTDVLIVGGGIAGILCAYKMECAGIPYILAEAETVCSGITRNTTAKITCQHGLICSRLIKEYGVEKARMYFEANREALKEYRLLCKNINCDFEEKDSYVYSTGDRKAIEKEVKSIEELGFTANFTKETSLPFDIAGAVRFPNQAQFNPLKFISSISEGLNIYEYTKICEFQGNKVVTNQGTIRAKKIIIATHFPIINKHGGYFLKQYQHRSYVIAFENAQQINGMYVDERKTGMSFRNYRDLLLIGGGGHRTGKQGGKWQEISDFASRFYPNAKERFRWAAQDCMTLDGIPYIGLYSRGTPDMYVATGFNKWGMTSAMAAASILTDMIKGKQNDYADLFSPARSMLHPQLFINAAEAAVNLLTPTAKRCPHLGCALKWNSQEHSWDCPCHGSRFDEDGALIDNPATDNLS